MHGHLVAGTTTFAVWKRMSKSPNADISCAAIFFTLMSHLQLVIYTGNQSF